MGVTGFLKKHYILSGVTGFVLTISAVGLLYVGITKPSDEGKTYMQGEQSLCVTQVVDKEQPVLPSISDETDMLIDVNEDTILAENVPYEIEDTDTAAKWSVGTLTVEETLHDIYVVFSCTNPYLNWSDVILYDSYKSKVIEPLETEVLPVGTVIFHVDRLKRGTWYIALNDISGYDVGFGTSLCFTLTEEELTEWLVQFKEENRVHPRGLDEETFNEVYGITEPSTELEQN